MYHRILYATDLSPITQFVGRKAWELASHFDAKLYLVHVVEFVPPYVASTIVEIENPHIEKAKQALLELGKKYMVPAAHQFVLIGLTKPEILKKAKELNVDLIVVGRHSRRGLSRLLGSTVSAILRDAECDVVTICPKS